MTSETTASPLHRPLDVSLYFACHAVAGFLLALPTTAVVAGTGLGRFPEGDRALFEPGGLIGAEVARTLAPALPSHVASSLGAAALLGVLLLLPHAALLVALARDARESRAATWGRAFAHFPALFALSGFALLAQSVVIVATLAVASALRDSLGGSTMRTADLAYAGALSLGLAGVLAIGIVRDLGRAAAVREALDAKTALLAALRAFGTAPGRSLARWVVPALAGIALVALGAALSSLLDVPRPATFRLALVALLHQAVAFALCFCRAYWLRASLGIVAESRS